MFCRGVIVLLALCVGYGAARPVHAGEPLDEVVSLAQQDWGEIGVNEAAHAPGKKGRPLQIGDKRYEQGIGTHANSRLTVDLWGEYALFEAEIGVQDP